MNQKLTLPLKIYYAAAQIDSSEVLNPLAYAEAIEPFDIIAFYKIAQKIKTRYIIQNQVSYHRIEEDELFEEYRKQARSLSHFKFSRLESEDEKLAFWINIYNFLIIDAVIQFEIYGSMKEDIALYSRAAYTIGEQRYSADDIEHGILRANAGHPFIPGPQFKTNDQRVNQCLTKLDPRIHFALNCGAQSCPPIAIYEANNIQLQLDIAAKSFVNTEGIQFNRATNTVSLSQLFAWYHKDFTKTHIRNRRKLVQYAVQFLDDIELKEHILNNLKSMKIIFHKYNWKNNSL